MSPAKAERYQLDWRKARRSMGAGDCVEVAPTGSKVLVRDSKNLGSVMLGYSAGAWRSFLNDAKQGHFDVLKLLYFARTGPHLQSPQIYDVATMARRVRPFFLRSSSLTPWRSNSSSMSKHARSRPR